MTPLIAALYMASAASLTAGLLAGAVWAARRATAAYGWFSLAALAFGASTFLEPLLYRAPTVEAFAAALRWQVFIIAVFLGLFTWFLKEYGGLGRSRLAYATLAVLVVLAFLNFASPHTLLFSDIAGLRRITLPWGETIVFGHGEPPPYWLLINLPGLLIVILFALAARRLWRNGERRRAAVLSLAFTPFAIAFWLISPASELGLIDAPYLHSFAYLAMVLLLGFELATQVARTSILSDEVREGERRWRALLDNVELFVTEVDRDGRVMYVNPYYSRVTGWRPGDVIGRPFAKLVPPEDREALEARFGEGAVAAAQTMTEVRVEARDGGMLDAVWASVPLMDSDGNRTGVLSIGSDVTERREAETARDQAIRDLEDLKRQLEEENLFLRQELESTHGFSELVGESDALRYVLHRIEQVAASDTTVLIEGETGVGKELVARAIHRRSSRAHRPFITVDCGGLPASLVENELFGHERGAFTGATGLHRGRFELADGGTIFLDEIGELPLDLQVKLLRVLETGEFSRVGASRSRSTDVRVIAATNRKLATEVEDGRFREDLYYRIHVFPITVPPLRERREDIPLLVHHFVRRLASHLGKEVDQIPGRTMRRLTDYSWPGNVRELQNVLERAVILSSGPALSLPPGFDAGPSADMRQAGTEIHLSLAELERRHIRAVLHSSDWRIEGDQGAASRLGLKPSTLRSRMKKHGINRTD